MHAIVITRNLPMLIQFPALLNVVENFLNISYLYLAHVADWPPATLVGFTSAAMTLSKTVGAMTCFHYRTD